mmetsp:Transcript_32289/g.91967  ORF Transcript_32289/g.91967 Transcript_32289/m.91967 type:complete len:295 (-) Transcript_32289:745-1629(-)
MRVAGGHADEQGLQVLARQRPLSGARAEQPEEFPAPLRHGVRLRHSAALPQRLDGVEELGLVHPAEGVRIQAPVPRLQEAAVRRQQLLAEVVQHTRAIRVDVPVRGAGSEKPVRVHGQILPEPLHVPADVEVLHDDEELPPGDAALHLRIQLHAPSGRGGAVGTPQRVPHLLDGRPAHIARRRACLARGHRSRIGVLLTLLLLSRRAEGGLRTKLRPCALRLCEDGDLAARALPCAPRVHVPNRELGPPDHGLQGLEQLPYIILVAQRVARLAQLGDVDAIMGVLVEPEAPSCV